MKKVIIASGPVIVRDKKVLLNKSGSDDFWKFCGGKVEKNENLEETATREFREEMGAEIKILNKKPFIIHVKKLGDEEKDVLLAHYLADFEGKIKAGKEVIEWKWFNVNDLPTDIAPNIIPTLRYFEYIK
ncbi:hypothetical protein C0583_06760 [Candidatus Parcubacteria bacterium]|nr:MAG: hypothetical protein C0583_06760 [Candidatus Parcubacteria bacterium]